MDKMTMVLITRILGTAQIMCHISSCAQDKASLHITPPIMAFFVLKGNRFMTFLASFFNAFVTGSSYYKVRVMMT